MQHSRCILHADTVTGSIVSQISYTWQQRSSVGNSPLLVTLTWCFAERRSLISYHHKLPWSKVMCQPVAKKTFCVFWPRGRLKQPPVSGRRVKLWQRVARLVSRWQRLTCGPVYEALVGTLTHMKTLHMARITDRVQKCYYVTKSGNPLMHSLICPVSRM